jgi:hypothetical protein
MARICQITFRRYKSCTCPTQYTLEICFCDLALTVVGRFTLEITEYVHSEVYRCTMILGFLISILRKAVTYHKTKSLLGKNRWSCNYEKTGSNCSSRRLDKWQSLLLENQQPTAALCEFVRTIFHVLSVSHTSNPKAETSPFVDYQKVINYYIPAFHSWQTECTTP